MDEGLQKQIEKDEKAYTKPSTAYKILKHPNFRQMVDKVISSAAGLPTVRTISLNRQLGWPANPRMSAW
jgi:hypothetical protein